MAGVTAWAAWAVAEWAFCLCCCWPPLVILFSVRCVTVPAAQAGLAGMGGFPPLGSGNDASFNAVPTAAVPTMMEAPLTPTPHDYQNFMQTLEKIQLAWGAADMNHLRQYVTPEMLGYFSEELSANVSRGIVNHISNVSVTEGTLMQAWSEQDLDYATVHLKWNAVDYMARADRETDGCRLCRVGRCRASRRGRRNLDIRARARWRPLVVIGHSTSNGAYQRGIGSYGFTLFHSSARSFGLFAGRRRDQDCRGQAQGRI